MATELQTKMNKSRDSRSIVGRKVENREWQHLPALDVEVCLRVHGGVHHTIERGFLALCTGETEAATTS